MVGKQYGAGERRHPLWRVEGRQEVTRETPVGVFRRRGKLIVGGIRRKLVSDP